MNKFSQTAESLIRNWIMQIVQDSIPTAERFRSPYYFSTDADYLSFIDQEFVNNYPIEYFMLSFGMYKNSLKKGCEDDPDVFLIYEAQYFRRFHQDNDANENSHDIIVNNMILLRDKVLQRLDIEPNKKTILSFDQAGGMVKYEESEYVAGIFGDWFNFEITVEVTS